MPLDFIIAGAQKAATSSLQRALRATPGVSMPAGESVYFEDPEYDNEPWRDLENAGYSIELFGIKRPNILCRDDQILRVVAAVPDAKIIAVLREPISRAISAHYYLMRHAHVKPRGLDAGLGAAIESFHRGDHTPESSIIEFGLYGLYLRRWLENTAVENLLVLSQRTVNQDLSSAVARCYEFLGLNTTIEPNIVNVRENTGIYNETIARVHAAGHSLKTEPIGSEGRRVPSSNVLARAAGGAITWGATRISPATPRPPILNGDTRELLTEIYAADHVLLEDLPFRNSVYWSY